jgi:hypothetical protein
MYNTSSQPTGGMGIALSNFPKRELTIEMWVRPTLFGKANGFFTNRTDGQFTPLSLTFGLDQSGARSVVRVDATPAFPDLVAAEPMVLNQWAQVYLTVSNTAGLVTQGRNGNRVATGSLAQGAVSETHPVGLGRLGLGPSATDGTGQFVGQIALVRVYSRALSDAELRRNWLVTRRRFGL